MVEFEIIGAIEVFDQFPIPFANGACGTVMVIMGVVPMDCLPLKLGQWVLQKRKQAEPVHGLVSGQTATSDLHEGRIKIIGNRRFGTSGSRFDPLGMLNDQGYSDSSS